MKKLILLGATLACALPIAAQDAPTPPLRNGLPFPLIAPAEVEKLATLKPIKLRFDDVTVAEALEELQKQSGVELDLESVNYSRYTLAKRVSFDIETRSFRRAFAAIMDAAKLDAKLESYDFSPPWRVTFGPGTRGKGAPQSAQGLFALRIDSISSRLAKSLDLTGQEARSAQQDDVTALVTLLPDPALPVLGRAEVRLTRAEDEQGRSLLAPINANQQRNEIFSVYQTNRQRQLNLTLLPPAEDAATLAHLEGVVVYALASATERWEIPDLLSAPTWKREFSGDNRKYAVTISAAPAAARADGAITLSIEVTADHPAPADQIAPPMLDADAVLNALKLRDSDGLKWNSDLDRSNGEHSPNQMKASVTFTPAQGYGGFVQQSIVLGAAQPAPAKAPAATLRLTFDAPVEAVQTEAPFSFENLPLP